MKPIPKKATALISSCADGGSPVLDSEKKANQETLPTNVPGDMKALPEVEESFEKASPGSGYGEVKEKSQHEREGEYSCETQDVGAERKRAPGAEKVEVGEAERQKEPGAEKNEPSLHPGKQDELQNFQTVEQNHAKQEVESFSAQSPIAIEQNQAKQEVDSSSSQSTNKQVSNSTTQNGLLERSLQPLGGSKGGTRMDVSVKLSWSKANSDFNVNSETEFTMEAMAWPTLAEARERKTSKRDMPVPKPASSKVEDFTPPSLGRKPLQFQKPISEIPRHGVNVLPASKYYKRGHMMGKSNYPAIENLPLLPVHNAIALPNGIRKHNEHTGMKGSVASSQWVSGNFHNQAWRSPQPVNTANGHNSMHESGRGHHPGWYHTDTSHGFGQCLNNRFNCRPRHEFNIAPAYPQPFYNSNPAFYNVLSFQMWHDPAGFNNGAMNMAPPGPPRGRQSMFGSVSTEDLIQRQIEYYFSIENLRADIYLKSLMDSEGFVPVSLIARFNRMRKLTSSHLVILEALKNSTVVEVKGDKIRRAQDWRVFVSSLSERRLTEGTCQTPITERTILQNNQDSCPAHEQWPEDNNAEGDLIISPNSFKPSSASVVFNNDPNLIPKTVAEPDNTSTSSLQNQGQTKDSMEMNERRFVEVSHSQLRSYIAVP